MNRPRTSADRCVFLGRSGDQRTVTDLDDVEAATVVTVVGRDVPRCPDLAEQANGPRGTLDGRVERVVDSWAPTVHSGLFVRERLQGLVQFHPHEEERAVTGLFAAEAGAPTCRDEALSVTASGEGTLTALRETASGRDLGRRP